jgi:hypothetical protein
VWNALSFLDEFFNHSSASGMAKKRPDARQFAADLRRLAAILDAMAGVDEAGGENESPIALASRPRSGSRPPSKLVASKGAVFNTSSPPPPAKKRRRLGHIKPLIVAELKADAERSDKEVSEIVGCHASHVGKIRKAMKLEDSDPAEDARPPPAIHSRRKHRKRKGRWNTTRIIGGMEFRDGLTVSKRDEQKIQAIIAERAAEVRAGWTRNEEAKRRTGLNNDHPEFLAHEQWNPPLVRTTGLMLDVPAHD